jgi:hypothetical protein
MTRPCTICGHPDREQIDLELVHNTPRQAIMARYNVSYSALKRHKAHHLLPAVAMDPVVQVTAASMDITGEMIRLYNQISTRLEQADQTNNWQAVRGLHAEARNDLELLAKLMGQLQTGITVNMLLVSPEWIRLRDKIVQALEPYPEARYALAVALDENLNGGNNE